MKDLLHIGVLVAAAWAVLGLVALVVRARSYGRITHFTRPAGRAMDGIAYLFGPGLSPAAKESAREHLPTYFAGVGYHAGIFAGLIYLALVLAGTEADHLLVRAIQTLCLLGSLCGAGLLIKRLLAARLRGLSCPDDYIANLLTTGFVALACASASSRALAPAFLAEAGILLLYVPVGKIRHCFFFFVTRYDLGAQLGRRGTLPPRA